MKRYDMTTRQGRARRRGDDGQFNPNTLLPHSKEWLRKMRESGMREWRRKGNP